MGIRMRMGGATLALGALVLGACGGAGDAAVEEAPEGEMTSTPGAASGAMPGLVNPNLAGEEELAAVEGLSPEAIVTILDGRPFLDMTSLDAALTPHMGMGPRSALYRQLWVPINLNEASEAELLLIPDVGDRMAYEFDEYRPYDGMARFRREMGKYVDEEQVEAWVPYLFLPLDLNTATDAEILAIPGVGDRMLREFKEYRPYTSMEQFMREIGKYVDDDELARLARYVTVGEN